MESAREKSGFIILWNDVKVFQLKPVPNITINHLSLEVSALEGTNKLTLRGDSDSGTALGVAIDDVSLKYITKRTHKVLSGGECKCSDGYYQDNTS